MNEWSTLNEAKSSCFVGKKTTGMFPDLHCAFVNPWSRSGWTRPYDWSRFLRATAVRMKRPATRLAAGSTLAGVGGVNV